MESVVGSPAGRILYLVHGFPPAESTGTPLVAEQYATGASRRGWRVTVVSADPSVAGWDSIRTSRPGQLVHHAVPTTLAGTWAVAGASTAAAPGANRWFLRMLRRSSPDLVHVVDNVHLPLDWPELAARTGIPVVRTVSSAEDLCGLVPPVSPRSGPEGFCGAPLTPEHCAECLEAVYGRDAGWPAPPGGARPWLVHQLQTKRARANAQFASVFTKTLFSTEPWRRYFEATLPLPPERVRVVPMGMDLGPWRPPVPRVAPGPGEPVVLALAGSLHPSRGHADVVEAFSRGDLLERRDYRLVLLGSGDAQLVAPLLECNDRVDLHGPYQPGELPGLLARAHVGLSTSLFETFHRVSREYLLAGLPVVANPTFGIEGLILDGVNGLLYDRTVEQSLARTVCSLLDDRDLLARLTAGAAESRSMIRDADDEVDEILELYAEVLAASPRRRRRLPRLWSSPRS